MKPVSHTPGPWTIGEPKTLGAVDIFAADGMEVAEAIYSAHDARLIAAAPEIFKAAKAVLGDLRGWTGCVRRSHGHHSQQSAATDQRYSALRAAIAKAEGRAK